jgi:hypothetical protein
MRRFEVFEENGLPARLFDSPKRGDVRLPTGVPKFTLLNTFCAATENVRL